MKLNAIMDNLGARQDKKRLGRGIGSGKGKTAGRGHKGQRARSGAPRSGTFEGGQSPIFRRLPQIGFTNHFAKRYATVNLGDLQKFIDAGKLDAKKLIDVKLLKECGIIRRELDGLKVLGVGEIKSAVKIEAVKASKKAKELVEKLGGTITFKVKKTMKDRGAVEKGKLQKTSTKSEKKEVKKPVAKKTSVKKAAKAK